MSKDTKSYSDLLPREVDFTSECQSLDAEGKKCENWAEVESYIFEDPEMTKEWHVVYFCKACCRARDMAVNQDELNKGN